MDKARAKAEEKLKAMTATPEPMVETTAPGQTATPAPTTTQPTPTTAGAPAPTAPPAEAPATAQETPAAPPTEDPLTPAPTDPPAVVAQKTQAQAIQQQLLDYAQRMLTATEDPVYKQQFNQLLMQSALQNQAAMDAVKMQIGRDPNLRGQPAGNALLGLRASQLNMSLDQMKAALNIESARAVADMNRYGFETMYKLQQDMKSQDEKDLDFYGNVFDRLIASGDEAGAEKIFNERIKPLLGDLGVDMTSQMFRNAAERNRLVTESKEDRLKAFREALAADDMAGALGAIEAAYSPEEQARRGKTLMEGLSVDEINDILRVAGYDEISDVADLIGREDDVFIADEVRKAQAKQGETAVTQARDLISTELRELGYDITDPEIQDAIDDMVEWQLYGDPENPYTFPWADGSPSQYRYTDWPELNQATGEIVYRGYQNYGEGNPKEADDVWQRTLDAEWQKYLQNTPVASRLDRKEWFNRFQSEYKDYAKENPEGGLAGFIAQGGVQDTGPVDTGWANADDAQNAIRASRNPFELLGSKGALDEAVRLGVVERFNSAADMPTTNDGWNELKGAAGNSKGMVEIGGTLYQIFQEGSGVTKDTSVGRVVVLLDADGNKYVMKVNTGGKYNIPVGVPIPYDDTERATVSFERAGLKTPSGFTPTAPSGATRG